MIKKQKGSRFGTAYFAVTAGILLSKALGFFRDVIFASEMGAEEAAAYIGDGENYTLQYSR